MRTPVARPRALLASLVVLCLAGCPRAAAPVSDGGATVAVAPQATAADCTLATPLVPGVPGSPGHLLPSPMNPNGASALAALMRTFVDDLRGARAALARGERPAPLWARHRAMRCAWPTDLRDRDARFDAMAVSYLVAVQALDATPGPATYDGVLAACRACHEVTCGGPLAVIRDLARTLRP